MWRSLCRHLSLCMQFADGGGSACKGSSDTGGERIGYRGERIYFSEKMNSLYTHVMQGTCVF